MKKLSRPMTVLAGAIAALAITLAGCSSGTATADAPTTVSVDVATLSGHVAPETFLAAAAAEGVTIIDVRTPEEFAAGHLPAAVNHNVEGADFLTQIGALDPEGTYALYCRSANRSRVAEEAMLQLGFTNVFGLEGGVTALDPSELVTT